jgi:hypothetical protein
MTYETLDEILADIGKSNVTPKHLIQAAYNLGAGIVEEVEEVEEEEIEEEVEEEFDISTSS